MRVTKVDESLLTDSVVYTVQEGKLPSAGTNQ